MNIYQCEEKAKEIGFNTARFIALFPAGPKECKWLDAYMGLFVIDEDGLRDGFVMTRDIDKQFPDLYCSEPFVSGSE